MTTRELLKRIALIWAVWLILTLTLVYFVEGGSPSGSILGSMGAFVGLIIGNLLRWYQLKRSQQGKSAQNQEAQEGEGHESGKHG